MSNSPSGSPAPSPSRPTGAGGSAFKSKIAAFESGAAANASKRDQSKHIPHADLSNLRSRFDREGEKPLEVKGSFGLGAAPPTRPGGGLAPGKDGHRAVSLGIGRAVSPMQSPSVVVPGPSPTGSGRSASSTTASNVGSGGNAEARLPTSSSRPQIPRSDSMGSNSTSATSTSISGATATSTSTASSLLPAPLAALRASGSSGLSSSPYGADDSTSTGLRTPMSSISLSSLHVEAGSVAGDVASSSGDTTANEDETSGTEPSKDSVVTPPKEPAEGNLLSGNATSELGDQSVELSAAALEQKKEHNDAQIEKKAPSVLSEDSLDSQQPPQEAVDRAEKELNKYSLEEPATTAVISPSDEDTALPPSISLIQLEGNDKETEAPAAASTPDQMASPPPPASRKSPIRTSSSAFSPADRLKRSSTANSIASHPESDVADTNLDAFDEQDDSGKGRMVADSMAPPPARRPSFEPPTTPSRSKANTPTTGKTSPIDDLLAQEQDFLPIDAVDDVDGADEDGMPLVKCSDCGAKVSLVKLADHVCGPSSSSKVAFPSSSSAGDFASTSPFRDRRETGPEDVPKGALSPETVDSPQMSHRSVTSSRPDVPDDESLASISASMEDTHLQGSLDPSARQDSGSSLPTDNEEGEEDYMTALTSHRDSMDTNNTQRPDFMSNLPESISDPRLYSMHSDNTAAATFNVDEDDETEELAIGMADHPIDTPRMGTFSQQRQIQPDSPTPEHRTLPANGATLQATPQKISSANKLATPSHDFGGATGVRRRSSAGKRNKALGDTDSEGEIEPGTVTIIR